MLQPAKMIYFPLADEAGCTKGCPAIVFIQDQVGDDYRGAPTLDELELGRFRFYPRHRTFTYSETAWDLCQIHILKRTQLEEEFKGLIKACKIYNRPVQTIAFDQHADLRKDTTPLFF